MTKNPKIKVTENGPYVVTGGIPLTRMRARTDSYGDPCRWLEVEKYPERKSYALCRCRKSGNKPYCDGAHVLSQFNGVETVRALPKRCEGVCWSRA